MSHENLENKNVYILNFGKVSTTNQTKRNQRKVLRSVRTAKGDARTAEGDARSLYGIRCADLYGQVAFARCAARSLYGMRCADRGGRCAVVVRDAMRCAVVVRDAMRGLVAFARCSCKRRQRHAFDGGILRVGFLGSVQH